MLSIQKLLIAYNSTARVSKAQYIVIHDVGAVSTAKNNRDYFAGGDRQASADFFIDSNNIIQIIDYHTRYSWAIGDGHNKYGKSNSNTVSIEMCLESNHQPSAQTIQNTLDLTHYLMKELGISSTNVVRHYDCSHKCCPGSFSSNNWAQWNQFKARLNSDIPIIGSVNNMCIKSGENSRRVSLLQSILNVIFTGSIKTIDGSFGPITLAVVKRYQTAMRLTVDGIVGRATINVLMLDMNNNYFKV